MALELSSNRLGVGKPNILAALLVMSVSLVQFLTMSMLNKQVEQQDGLNNRTFGIKFVQM